MLKIKIENWLDLYPSDLGRPATVMGNGRNILNGHDLKTVGLQRPDGGFPSRTDAFNKNINLLHAGFSDFFNHILNNHASGVRSGFFRTFKTALAGRTGSQNIAVLIAKADHGIVISSLNVRLAALDAAFDFLFSLDCFFNCYCHIYI